MRRRSMLAITLLALAAALILPPPSGEARILRRTLAAQLEDAGWPCGIATGSS